MLRGHKKWARIIARAGNIANMPNLTNPSEIARETLKLLASRRTPPTPDNYLTIYHEISGTRPAGPPFPEKPLRSLANALPRTTPDQLRLARQLEEAVKREDWDDYRKHLVTFVNSLCEGQKLTWSQLIGDLVSQWDAKHAGLTTARKREALEHILGSAGSNPETLFNRLQAMLRVWGKGKEKADDDAPEAATSTHGPVDAPSTGP